VGEVVSVNVAEVRTLQRRGRAVRTGLWKQPVQGRVKVHDLGLEGDVNADKRYHGGNQKAVYAYAGEDIAWWESELGRELGPGFFGENLTLSGVDVSEALVGERWEVGTAVVELTEPRTPCWKLATKVGDPGFERRFARANRPGAYLSVVRPGEVGAGDAVRVDWRPPDGALTMARLAPGAA